MSAVSTSEPWLGSAPVGELAGSDDEILDFLSEHVILTSSSYMGHSSRHQQQQQQQQGQQVSPALSLFGEHKLPAFAHPLSHDAYKLGAAKPASLLQRRRTALGVSTKSGEFSTGASRYLGFEPLPFLQEPAQASDEDARSAARSFSLQSDLSETKCSEISMEEDELDSSSPKSKTRFSVSDEEDEEDEDRETEEDGPERGAGAAGGDDKDEFPLGDEPSLGGGPVSGRSTVASSVSSTESGSPAESPRHSGLGTFFTGYLLTLPDSELRLEESRTEEQVHKSRHKHRRGTLCPRCKVEQRLKHIRKIIVRRSKNQATSVQRRRWGPKPSGSPRMQKRRNTEPATPTSLFAALSFGDLAMEPAKHTEAHGGFALQHLDEAQQEQLKQELEQHAQHVEQQQCLEQQQQQQQQLQLQQHLALQMHHHHALQQQQHAFHAATAFDLARSASFDLAAVTANRELLHQ